MKTTTVKAWAARDGNGEVWLHYCKPEKIHRFEKDVFFDSDDRQHRSSKLLGLKKGDCCAVTITIEEREDS